MSKNLVIVESPAKAKTINKFLGKDYHVEACMGHVRDLPKTQLGIDINNGFAPKYSTIRDKMTIVKELRGHARKSDTIYLATDLDREGEAIAWHLCEALKIPQKKIARVIFNEITAQAIKNAFANVGHIEMNKVHAQQARRLLDRLVGYQLSPLLWEKIARGLSAGRVQSVAVKIIVDREKEIRAFISQEYWKIHAQLSSATSPDELFETELKKAHGKKIEIPNEQKSTEILQHLAEEKFIISDIVRKQKTEKPPPPFTTSLLQQQASIRLRFRAKHTMRIAQQLYEGLELGASGPIGLITYMRTDSVHVSREAIAECRDWIAQNYPEKYLPKSPHKFKNKKAQEAHEAIRPTSVLRTPQQMQQHLSADQYRLYKLIWDRFVTSQMQAARYALTTVVISAGDYLFESKGKQILFPGYTVLNNEGNDKDEKRLPALQNNEILNVHQLTPSQHFTQHPPRYTEATLVKTLEAKGIGRPSTYAPIITTIQDRGYVKLQERKFLATELGIKVTEQLSAYFGKIMDLNFTAQMEDKLDKIDENQLDWVSVLKDFYDFFAKDLEAAYKKMQNFKKNPEISGYKCSQCNADLIYRFNKNGKFLGCSRFPECKNTIPIDANGEPVFPKITEYKCDKCGEPMVVKQGKQGKFFGCSGFPQCKNALPMGIEGKPVVPEKTDTTCPKCGEFMWKRHGPRGPFLACSRYPDCKTALPLERQEGVDLGKLVNAKCEKCHKPFTIRKGPRGFFIGCSGYPQCKNIKKLSTELLRLPEELLNQKCEICSKPMTLRSSRKGVFWGCTGYPQCNTTIPCDLYELAAKLNE